MSRKWKLRVEDALQSIYYIQEDTKNMTYEDFEDNRLVRQAVERNLEIIGEALNRIPDDIQNKYPKIPWREIIGVRNFVIHQYFQVSQDIEWDIITNDLEGLKEGLIEIKNNELEE
ncbi:HepT-like ribonuclease domain-containing protein [Ilyobacter polytropus]|jgi:uncharacterized protein with HEPN domain|uniref:DUF86 domain-containing protein n=1 Tax=Ilyobacter polytropus (strain ATCC 51220 / DSM 2926 / LMG 16218 / CuHBu1) TaxID=572544 RepID=E3H9N0_ILYPC|nr:DUF86 domain-containing protein [Ilyobacter polytropus]ADO83419.1 protein of unknown function DUF86 [Ilyobacter polytropus DSM 2926]